MIWFAAIALGVGVLSSLRLRAPAFLGLTALSAIAFAVLERFGVGEPHWLLYAACLAALMQISYFAGLYARLRRQDRPEVEQSAPAPAHGEEAIKSRAHRAAP